MKQCPICNSLAFDDALICYGCLHEFTDDDDCPVPATVQAAPTTSAAPQLASFETPPGFVIQIKPERERSGQVSWTCKVDLVPA